jgi:hypothetical protein
MKKDFSYSKILIEFIDPLLTGEEDESEFLSKARLGQVAWNFNVSDSNDLPYDDDHKKILFDLSKKDERFKETLNRLVKRKALKFSQYNQFLFKVEMRRKADGQATLYVESAPADKIG